MAIAQKARVPDLKTVPGTATASASATQGDPPPEKIAIRAYEIWRASGCPEGKHEEHWYRAERELRAQRAPLRSR